MPWVIMKKKTKKAKAVAAAATNRLTKEKFMQVLNRLRQLQDEGIDFDSLEREKNEAVRAGKYFFGYQLEGG